jgi:hypothetical protein
MEVDLVFLSRDLSPPRSDVQKAIESQAGVALRVHRVVGTRLPDDPNRFATIARARNAGKRLGTTPWVMFLDDDVVLGRDCVARLVEGLQERPGSAALAADCAGEMSRGWDHWDYPRHVGMASTLFRRRHLDTLTFRWEPEKCECRCCCEDLRRAGLGIGYLNEVQAWHRPRGRERPHAALHPVRSGAGLGTNRGESEASTTTVTPPGRILTAFDRNHFRPFIHRFLATLRSSGNREQVTAVTYRLYPSQQRQLAQMPGMEVVGSTGAGHPAQRRLRDFADIIARWPGDTPVAYWDAGDVIFQDAIKPLWDLVRASRDRLLVARELFEFHQSALVTAWVESIRDPEARRRALELLMPRPVLNSGFAAGTARALLRYLREADRLRHSHALRGSTDWGDQTALNLFCATNPEAWCEVPRSWNYCLVGLGRGDYRVRLDGRTESGDGTPVYVVHGNARTLGPQTLVHLNSY